MRQISENHVKRMLMVLGLLRRFPQLRLCGWFGPLPVLELRPATRPSLRLHRPGEGGPRVE